MALEHNDRVKEAPDASAHRGLQHVDRMELFQDHSKLTERTSTAQLHDLTITDDSAPANKTKDSPNAPKVEGALDKGAGKDNKGGAEEPTTELVKKTEKDPKAPTVAFLDDFKHKDVDLGDGTFVAHGEISRASAEAQGFNTIALQNSDKRDPNNDIDYSKRFNEIGKKIDAGELNLGRGDVLNVSLGNNNDPTFEQANQFLGFSGDKAITRENLAANKDAILSRMNEISQDPTRSDADRTTAQRVVDTNKAIDDLKAKGIEVVHAAGNDSADRFSWDFMNASTVLASTKPSGKPDDFSASHSLTTPGDGVVPVHAVNEANLFSPTPIASQKGNLEIGDTGAKFPRTGRNIFAADNKPFDRENYQMGGGFDKLKVEPKPLDTALFDATPIDQRTLSGATLPTSDLGAPIPPSDKFSGAAPYPKYLDMIKKERDEFARPLKPGETAVEGVISGTSFANINYLKSEYERLRGLKSGND